MSTLRLILAAILLGAAVALFVDTAGMQGELRWPTESRGAR